jgi:hypothetical protein
MAQYVRILSRWTGGPSSPGLTVMNVGDLTPFTLANITAVKNFWDALAGIIPTAYSIQVDPVVERHNTETGALVGTEVAGTAPAPTVGTYALAWGAGVGCRISWQTGAVVNGHRVQGRTYIVPVGVASLQSDGTIAAATITTVQNAATALISALGSAGGVLSVYTAPREARAATATKPARAATVGVRSVITSASVPDQVAVLRGRRVA